MKAILTFHSIDDRGSVLSFPPARFARMITEILDSDVKICTLDQLLSPTIDNALAITFDDGMRSVYSNALPVLKDTNIPSHLYLTTGHVGGKNNWPTQPAGAPAFEMMNWEEIEACVKAGMQIENHTVSHPNLCQLDHQRIEDECETADLSIEKHFGRRPRHFAYPYGLYDARVAGIVGPKYQTCVTTALLPLGRKLRAAELPRLDSYYLQTRRNYRHFFSPTASSYLRLRHWLRVFRSRL